MGNKEEKSYPERLSQYWEERWQQKNTGWDVGYATPPLINYAQQLQNKSLRILIPGCGNAYEAQHLQDLGFQHITLLDVATAVVEKLKMKYKDSPVIQVIQDDFFVHQGEYDLILEQTFFCAFSPDNRLSLLHKIKNLLADGGTYAGVLFDKYFEKPGPPFGGLAADYKPLFEESLMHLVKLENCYNSIPARMGTELFFISKKK